MKTITIIVLISLILTSCSVYKKGKVTEQYPAKYEYRCVGGVCKDVNANYVGRYATKEKYIHLSKEELKNKEKKNDRIKEYIVGTMLFGVPIAVGVNTAINTWGSGVGIAIGVGFLGTWGSVLLMYMGVMTIGSLCYSTGDDRYYDGACFTTPPKPTEVEQPQVEKSLKIEKVAN